MKKRTLVALLLICISTLSFAQKKWSLGLGVQTFNNKPTNIVQEERTAYFQDNKYNYLTPKVYSGLVLSYGAHFNAEKKIRKNISIDFGLGLQKTRDDLFLDYTPDTSAIRSNANMLNIERTYAYLPLNFNYFTPIGNNVRFKTSLGVSANYLVRVIDSYKDILAAEIGFVTYNQYSKINLLGKAKVGIQYETYNDNTLELNLFYNLGKFGTGGLRNGRINGQRSLLIYDNLTQAIQGQLGLEVNYFFIH